MGAIGGKYKPYMWLSLFVGILFISCDKSSPLDINDIRNCSLSSGCGTLTVNSFIFSNALFITQKFDGSFILQPDSLKIEFHPNSIEMRNVKFTLDDKEISSHEKINIRNNTVKLNFNLHSDIEYRIDTAKMFILPCNYILCNDTPLINDTIKVNLK